MIAKNNINKKETQTAGEALAKYLECETSDLNKKNYDHYGLEIFSLGQKEYAVGTNNEVDNACIEYIKNSVWAFNSSFICNYCNLPQEIAEAFEIMQSKKCENANDAILALIEKADNGLEGFAEEAISADGRGHFLAQYDSEENEQDGFYIYRIN